MRRAAALKSVTLGVVSTGQSAKPMVIAPLVIVASKANVLSDAMQTPPVQLASNAASGASAFEKSSAQQTTSVMLAFVRVGNVVSSVMARPPALTARAVVCKTLVSRFAYQKTANLASAHQI